jgi:hypothetical protein
MFSAYVLVTAFTAVANTFSATCDLVRYEQVAVGMAQAGVPESWMTALGALKMAGALGVLIGIVVPALGVAAASGLVLFFVGAIVTHLRVRDYSPSLGLAAVFLLLAAGSLITRLAV